MKRKSSCLYMIITAVLCSILFVCFAETPYVKAAEEQELVQNEETRRFSNTADGAFDLSIAKKTDSYMGVAVDESTGLKYALIQYNGKLWAVVASKKSAYNGSYDTSSYVSLSSRQFDAATTKTSLLVKKNKTGNSFLNTCFYYAEDDSVFTTGVSKGIYYIDGAKAKGIKKLDGSYYLFKSGKKITKKGWHTSGKSQVYISGKKVKYSFNGMVCYQYKNGKKKKVTSRFVLVNGVSYRFDSKGNPAQGFQEIDGKYYYFADGRAETNVYKKVGSYGYYFGDDGAAVSDTWVRQKTTERYFNASCRNTKIYYTSGCSDASKAGRFRIYKKKKWSWVTTGVYRINGVYRFFKNGTEGTTSCWYDASDTTSYYMKKGVVLYKRTYKNDTYTLYQLVNNKWIKATDTWTPSKKGEIWYFDKNGSLKYKYFTESYSISTYRKTVWVWSEKKSKWKKRKNKVVRIKTSYYCASSDGTLYDTEGWHTIDEYTAAYTEASGKVTRYIYFDEEQGVSVYREGKRLDTIVSGLVTVEINGQTVYYMLDAAGKSCTGSIEADHFMYDFDRYGRAYSRKLVGALYADTDAWMKRVMASYLGTTGIYCNTFVNFALALAGSDDPSCKLAVRYQDETNGGIILNRSYAGTEWGGTAAVTGQVILSDGTSWMEEQEVVLNSNLSDFSYEDLTPGDVIIYYKDGETDASHVSLYLGQFQSADAVREYLKQLGVKKAIRETCVKDWGTCYGNDGTYWCIHGGMGSGNQVYISNSTYCIPSGDSYTYARKIANIF